MIFNSYIFIFLFLPITLAGYFILQKYNRPKLARAELVIASACFYAYANPAYVLALLLGCGITYALAVLIYKNKSRTGVSGAILTVGVVFQVLVLGYFKYQNFFATNFNNIFDTSIILQKIIIPIGVSFIAFNQISFMADLKKEEFELPGIWDYLLYIFFFPKLLQGPITRFGEFMPQFQERKNKHINYENLARGLYIFCIGLGKKVLLADVFGNVITWAGGYGEFSSTLTALDTAIVILSYTFEIYFDFSGYSDMAYGISKMFNITLPVNFLSPYRAHSILEFWKGWHITLTSFFRQYIYIPLGGNRKGIFFMYVNVMIVFFVSGLWHGAAWKFVVWGVAHGIAYCLCRLFHKQWERVPGKLQWLFTFIFVNLTWTLFYAGSIKQALGLIVRLFTKSWFQLGEGLRECFAMKEINFLVGWFATDYSAVIAAVGLIIMILYLVLSLWIVLKCKNMYEKEWKPSWIKMVYGMGLFFWSVISLTHVADFIYGSF